MKDFKKLIVWQKGMDLFVDLHLFTRKLPAEEKFELGSQIRRAAFSIPANIAEGGAKATKAHYKVFLETSLGSAYELETAMIALERIYPGLQKDALAFMERTIEIQKMLISFINKVT
jgi:four helix bundle protein